jgi:hypothetical protein
VNIRILDSFGLGCVLLVGALGLTQDAFTQDAPSVPVPPVTGTAGSAAVAGDSAADMSDANHMQTPPPVSGTTYPVSFTSEERANYLRGGVTFTSAYSDNAFGSINGHPVSDVSYSVWPTLAIDQSRSRLHWVLTYAPGFTFYQRETSYNEADENLAMALQYRVSPHVTFSAQDGLQKSSNVFNQPDLSAAAAVSGGIQQPNQSVIAPVADRLGNAGNVGIAYQFAANSMVGASGTFSNLHYPDAAQVPGLYDAASQSGSAFYAVRVSKMHYFGVSYQYQRLLSYPTPGTNETQTHAVMAFYTLSLSPHFSVSAFGGPQYANVGQQFSSTALIPGSAFTSWNPSAGASLSWQGRLSNIAISYAHTITAGSGLIGAVKTENANASFRQQLLPKLSASVAALYAQNDVLASTTLLADNGHTWSGTASLQQQFGQHWNLQLGYTRLREDYSTVAVLAATPDTNREFVSISYQFARPLGR